MRIVLGCFLWFVSVLAVAAHEVRPAIGDLEAGDGSVSLVLTMNAEAWLAGVDLEGVEDTNATEGSDRVDALRALSPDEIAQQIDAQVDDLIDSLEMRAGDTPVMLSVSRIEPGPVGDIELPRDTVIAFTGILPDDARTVSLGWPARLGTLILRQQGVEEGYTGYLAGDRSGPISVTGGDERSGLGVFAQYIPVGFDHILPKGLDHILFVLGLFFLSTRLGPLLWQISAFTLAHTVTLALGALGYVNIPGSIVEPIIAASIVYVAVENLISDKLHRWRPAVIFVFGLLHGLGFASVLGEFGLPEGQFIPALIGFNIGVEIGQLTVIAIAFGLVLLAQRVDRGDVDLRTGQIAYGIAALGFVAISLLVGGPGFDAIMGAGAPVFFWPLAGLCVLCALAATNVDKLHAYRRFVAMPASLAIACVGAYWFVERVFL